MKWLITGGAGFIGSNLAHRLLGVGGEVVVFDNLSRPGARRNLEWLEAAGSFTLVEADVRDRGALERTLAEHGPFDAVAHQAAQVAVTTSVTDPRDDFETNALGTFNVLEAVRAVRTGGHDPVLLFASTNKVYGGLEDVAVTEEATRHRFRDLVEGVPESRPLDFHSPYGCSKGAADQYVRDYARVYGLRTVVCRQSCIYGPRQFGVEDQGWVAWFVIAATLGLPITIFGDGKQVRDLLFVDDLVDLYLRLVERADVTAGRIYNVGGGPENVCSLLELLALLEELLPEPPRRSFDDWRVGDQPVYVSDVRAVERDVGWAPGTGVRDGVGRLVEWVADNRALLEAGFRERAG